MLNLSQNPEYGDIILNVEDDGSVTIVEAPVYAWIAQVYLSSPERAYMRVKGNEVLVAEKLVYKILGYDVNNVLVELVEDKRS